jgi:RNA polymerase sigma factor (sigma-70 family)
MRANTTDENLLASRDPEAFGTFYARHLAGVEAYFARRVGDRDVAADLASETFAAALVARRRFVPGPTPAVGWLYTIAARRYVDFQRRRAVQMRICDSLSRDLAVREPWSSEGPLEDADPGLLRHLPPERREAVRAHVLQGRDYSEIAAESGASEASIRQRVSRGLRTLRAPLLVYRAAQELARQDRAYRFGGGHRVYLSAIAPGDPLDCSAATSLVLRRAGLLESDTAWTSGRFADEWGEPGEGEHVTLWANEEHVWLELKLDDDHGERFDPTPRRLNRQVGWLSAASLPLRGFTPRRGPGL